MKTSQELYNERLTRLKKAIAIEKPDRTPVISWSDAHCAFYKGVKMSEFSSNIPYSSQVILECFQDFPTFDAAEVSCAFPDITATAFLCKMKIAGRDLPEGSMWQIDEQVRLEVEDYDAIINMGWGAFQYKFCLERLGIDLATFFPEQIKGMAIGPKLLYDAGLPEFTLAIGPSMPIEVLAGGRTFAKFMTDLYRIPDKVQAVCDVMMDEMMAQIKGALSAMPVKPLTLFLGASRGSSEFMPPKLWERFSYPYLCKSIDTVLELGLVANLHFDANWEKVLHRFKHYPRGTCVFASDHVTDMFKIKEILGDTMAIKGDVPAPLLTCGTPDAVYKYSRNLVETIGNGLILAPACAMPPNAKTENIKAMLAAVEG